MDTRERPLYRWVVELLRQRIIRGRYLPGRSLPTIGALAAEFGVSPDTVRQALLALRGEGIIECERGRPAWVRPSMIWQALPLPVGQLLIARMPSSAERVRLDVPEGVPVLVSAGAQYPADRVAVMAVSADPHAAHSPVSMVDADVWTP